MHADRYLNNMEISNPNSGVFEQLNDFTPTLSIPHLLGKPYKSTDIY